MCHPDSYFRNSDLGWSLKFQGFTGKITHGGWWDISSRYCTKMMSEKAAVGMWGPTDHPKNSCGHGKIQWIWEGARFSSKADRINLNHRDFALLQKNIVVEKWKFAKEKWNVKSNLLRSVPFFFKATKQTIYHFVDQRFGYVCVLFVCVRVCVSYCAFVGRLESRSVCLPKSPEFFEVTSSCTSRNWPMVALRIDFFKRWVEHTVDGRNPANQLRLVVYPIIYRVLHIPGGAGFLPSTVCVCLFFGSSKLFEEVVVLKAFLYRWWCSNDNFGFVTPKLGEMIHFQEYFSNGLVQPPTSVLLFLPFWGEMKR